MTKAEQRRQAVDAAATIRAALRGKGFGVKSVKISCADNTADGTWYVGVSISDPRLDLETVLDLVEFSPVPFHIFQHGTRVH